MENKNIVKEKEEKIKYIEKIRKNKSILKQRKIKLLSNIESNLLNDDVIDLRTFNVLCILENINYLLIDKHFYYEKIIDEENKLFVLHKNNNIYSYEINNKNNYKENKLQKVEIDKSFHCISHYTLKDLKEICEKINIVIHPTWKKKDIYDYLVKL
jgi:GTPase involved in cell partitioning and DNA repair